MCFPSSYMERDRTYSEICKTSRIFLPPHLVPKTHHFYLSIIHMGPLPSWSLFFPVEAHCTDLSAPFSYLLQSVLCTGSRGLLLS